MTNHSAKVYRLAYRLTGNKYDAEDLTQEVFVRVFRSLENFKPGTLDGWLHRITTNLFLDQARRKSRIRFDALADDAESRLPGREPGPGAKLRIQQPRPRCPGRARGTSAGLPRRRRAVRPRRACPTTKSPPRWTSNSGPSGPGSTAAGPCSGKSSRTATRARRSRPSSPSSRGSRCRASPASSEPVNGSAETFAGRPQAAGSGCRPGATRKRAAGRHDHVESCAECRARQQRERQYLEKLRGAAVPEASEDLTARLLARTEQLAADARRSGPAAAAATDARAAGRHAGRRGAAGGPAVGRRRGRSRTALMAGAAYLMGGDAGPPTDEPRHLRRSPRTLSVGPAAAAGNGAGGTARLARRRAGLHPAGPDRRAARRPALAGMGLSGAAGPGLPPRLGPRRGHRRGRGRWSCASRTAGTSPRSLNSTPRSAGQRSGAPAARQRPEFRPSTS